MVNKRSLRIRSLKNDGTTWSEEFETISTEYSSYYELELPEDTTRIIVDLEKPLDIGNYNVIGDADGSVSVSCKHIKCDWSKHYYENLEQVYKAATAHHNEVHRWGDEG